MENAPTAIMLSRLRAFLRTVERIALISDDVRPPEWAAARDAERHGFCTVPGGDHGAQSDFEAASGVHIILGLVEGCLLYWDQEIVDTLDTRVFLRWPYDVQEERRSQREYIVSAEGVPWKDLPGYFEHVAFPACINAHRKMYTNGDVEGGTPLLPGFVLIEPLE